MTFFINKKDPIRENINSALNKWDYGNQTKNASIQIYTFLIQYPEFELVVDKFMYNDKKTTSKVIYLCGWMLLNVYHKEYNIPLHFVLIKGFPSVAPKAFLSMKNDEDIIKENPFILK